MLPPFRAHVDVWVILGSLAAAYLIACRRHAADARACPCPTIARPALPGRCRGAVGRGGLADPRPGGAVPLYVHMAQHLLFTLVAAPLLVAGTSKTN